MFTAVLIAIAAVLGLGVIATGMTGRWRGNRAAYYTRSTVLSLIGLFAALSGWAFSQEYTAIGWVTFAVAAWIGLEAMFAIFKSSQAGDRLFTQPPVAEEVSVDVLEPEPAPAAAPARRNPTPRGPQPVRKGRKRR